VRRILRAAAIAITTKLGNNIVSEVDLAAIVKEDEKPKVIRCSWTNSEALTL
jgi:hypothetical protein